MDQFNQQKQQQLTTADHQYHHIAYCDENAAEIVIEEGDEDQEDEEVVDNDIELEPETTKGNRLKRKVSKWKPVWPGIRCADCCGICYFFYILFGCDGKKDHSKVSTQNADETIKSTSSLFNYATANQRRPTQMNIPLESELIKKDSIVSSITINDNNDQL